jgi:hypothetical protein
MGLDRVMSQLQQWSKQKFGSVNTEIEKARNKLEELMHMNADRMEIRAVTDKMNEMLYREEMMWMQRSRVDWLREGDRNTRFFHSKAIWRARKNRIKKLKDEEGAYQTDQGTMGRLATKYFRELFTADETIDPEPVLRLFEGKVT